jgi:hypothetical protein
MALCAILQHFGRPGTPTDQAWIESLFGHVKVEHPHLLAIADAEVSRAELDIRQRHYNSVRLHAGIGYVTPDDEHDGRGKAIRKARQAGLEQARLRRLAWHRDHRHDDPTTDPAMLANTTPNRVADSDTRQPRARSRRHRRPPAGARRRLPQHARALRAPATNAPQLPETAWINRPTDQQEATR